MKSHLNELMTSKQPWSSLSLCSDWKWTGVFRSEESI